MWSRRPTEKTKVLLKQHQFYQRREYGMFVVRALRGLLKIRYIILGGAVGGGVTLQKV